jgi:hypothetical protein
MMQQWFAKWDHWQTRRIKENQMNAVINEHKVWLKAKKDELEKSKSDIEKLWTLVEWKLSRSELNVDMVVQLEQARIEVPQSAFLTDYTDAIFIPKDDIFQLNDKIRQRGDEKVDKMKGEIKLKKEMEVKDWELESIQLANELVSKKCEMIKMMRVTKTIQNILTNKTKVKDLDDNIKE